MKILNNEDSKLNGLIQFGENDYIFSSSRYKKKTVKNISCLPFRITHLKTHTPTCTQIHGYDTQTQSCVEIR